MTFHSCGSYRKAMAGPSPAWSKFPSLGGNGSTLFLRVQCNLRRELFGGPCSDVDRELRRCKS